MLKLGALPPRTTPLSCLWLAISNWSAKIIDKLRVDEPKTSRTSLEPGTLQCKSLQLQASWVTIATSTQHLQCVRTYQLQSGRVLVSCPALFVTGSGCQHMVPKDASSPHIPPVATEQSPPLALWIPPSHNPRLTTRMTMQEAHLARIPIKLDSWTLSVLILHSIGLLICLSVFYILPLLEQKIIGTILCYCSLKPFPHCSMHVCLYISVRGAWFIVRWWIPLTSSLTF